MDAWRLPVRTRPGAILVTMAVAILTLVLPTGASAASWSQRRVADVPPAAIAVDDGGHLHVVLQSGAGLRYMTDATGAWTSRSLTSFGSQPSIALSAGKVYVVFVRVGDCGAERGCTKDPNQGLYFATNRSGAWKTQRLSDTKPAYWPSLRMRDGKLYIAYNHLSGIRYLTNSSGSWVDRQVWRTSTTLTASARTSIALDGAGHPYIAFMRTRCSRTPQFGWCAASRTTLRGISLTTRSGGRWVTSVASQPGDTQDTLDRVVIDPAGKPIVGFTHELASGALRFRVTRFDEMDSTSSRTLPGTGEGSFALDGQGRIELVRWADGTLTWRAERASGWLSKSWSTPQISAAWVRSVDGVTTIVRDGFANRIHAYATWVLTRD
jgi:hypothetical protein